MKRPGVGRIAAAALIVCCAAACTAPSVADHRAGGGAPVDPLRPVATSDDAHSEAGRICASAGVGALASAETTTVGAIRNIQGGHGLRPVRLLPTALPAAPAAARAAWCWTKSGPQAWTAYVVSPGVPPQRIGVVRGSSVAPVGAYPFR